MQFLKSIPECVRKPLLLCLTLLAGYSVAYHLADFAIKIFANYQTNYAEPVLLSTIFDIKNTPLIYRDLNNEPFIAPFYPPVYYYLAYVFSLVTGQTFACGRIVAFISSILVSVVIFKILIRKNVSSISAVLFSSLFLLLPLIQPWVVVVKNDMTAVLFNLAAIYFLLKHEDAESKKIGFNYALGITFFSLAFFTKQNFIFGMAAYALFLLIHRRWKNLGYFAAIQGAAVLVPALLWNVLTGGHFLKIIFLSHLQSFYPKLIFLFWQLFLKQTWWLVLMGVAFAADRIRKRQVGFLESVLFFGFATTLLAGKIGSDTNFFIELSAILCVCAGIFFSENFNAGQMGIKQILLAAFLGIFFIAPSVPLKPLASLQSTVQEIQRTRKAMSEVENIIKPIEGPIFAEEMGILISSKKKVWYEPFEFNQLAFLGRWDESKILRKLTNREFSIMLLSTDLRFVTRTQRFSPAFIKTLKEHYVLVGSKQGFFIYAPRIERSSLK